MLARPQVCVGSAIVRVLGSSSTGVSFLSNAFSAFSLSVPILQEIRQLQQKQASYIREISDLQETIEWKDKKIGVGVASL